MDPQAPATVNKPWLSNRTYDATKWVTIYFLPAGGALYFSLSQIWGFPKGAEVTGTVTVLITFLSVLLGLSNKSYNASDSKYDGVLNVGVNDDQELRMNKLEVDRTIEEIANKGSITIKVQRPVA